MNYDIQRTIQLLKQYLEGVEDPVNNESLKQLFDQYPNLLELLQEMDDPDNLEQTLVGYNAFQESTTKDGKERVLRNILCQIDIDKPQERSVVSSYRRILRYAAAAAVVAVLSFGLWKLNQKPLTPEFKTVKEAEKIKPGTNRAILSTADGTVIELNAEHSGIVVGDVITYNDGSVLLKDEDDKNIRLTLATPRGGQYQITLPDGTKVWLNAASKLSYPKVFSDKQRLVDLDGEAYFEVARKEHQPFIVKTSSEQVEVLGTHFNVNSYVGEDISKVALAEGKVNVRLNSNASKILHPGQQTIVQGKRVRVEAVNVDEVIAWKNGEFMFNNEPLPSAMRQLARWYDIDIEVDPALQGLALWGSVSRLENFDKVLKIIKMTDDNIQVHIAGRRVRLMK